MLTKYIAYYMRSRTHLALGENTPSPRPVSPLSAGRIVATPEVDGLHHRYGRIAAQLSPDIDPSYQPDPNQPCVELSCVAVRCADVPIPKASHAARSGESLGLRVRFENEGPRLHIDFL